MRKVTLNLEQQASKAQASRKQKLKDTMAAVRTAGGIDKTRWRKRNGKWVDLDAIEQPYNAAPRPLPVNFRVRLDAVLRPFLQGSDDWLYHVLNIGGATFIMEAIRVVGPESVVAFNPRYQPHITNCFYAGTGPNGKPLSPTSARTIRIGDHHYLLIMRPSVLTTGEEQS